MPLISSIFLFFLRSLNGKNLKKFAFTTSLLPLTLLLYENKSLLGTHCYYRWVDLLNLDFHLYMDNVSYLFSFLTLILIPLSILSMPTKKIEHPHLFFGLILLLEAFLIGLFTAHNLILFLIFWESMLLPLFFMILIWGKERRKEAAMKFLIYMMAGSLFLILSIFAIYFMTHSFSLYQNVSSMPYGLLFLSFFILAFAVKTPMFPFHGWLPLVYHQAPVAGSILLAGLLSKAGIYGFIRIGLGMFPELIHIWGPILTYFAIFGVLYGAFAAWRQTDFKRLIAYSSFSHVNFILAGLFIWHEIGYVGSIMQAINHGITISGLFILAYWLEMRIETTSLEVHSGLCNYMPKLCWFTLFFVLASVALPGTNNFIGELLILFGYFQVKPYLGAILALTMIFSVIYMLRWMQMTYFESPKNGNINILTDIGAKEICILLPLIILILWIGFYPQIILKFFPTVTL